MPRKRKLTWQSGSDGRPGRWRKKFRGRTYYFSGGKGKSDQAAYGAADDEWRQLKARIQAEAPKRHQAEYEREIGRWSQVLAWCRQQGDEAMAEVATQKIGRLRTKVAFASPEPLSSNDSFDGHFELANRCPHYVEAIDEFIKTVKRNESTKNASDGYGTTHRAYFYDDNVPSSNNGKQASVFAPTKPTRDLLELREIELEFEKEIWLDRLNVMHQRTPVKDKTVGAQVELFLKAKQHEVGSHGITVSRHYALQLHLNGFADWRGRDTAVDKISGQDLVNYRLHLLSQVSAQKLAISTASDRLSSVKGFVRWLWQTEAISQLPRVMDSRSKVLEIGKTTQDILTFTEAEIATLLKQASERTRLYILLSLNTGMTQKDIADLQFGLPPCK